MIINYLELGSELYPPAIGYFEADKEIHKYLISSENPSHSAWESNSKRLFGEFSDIGKKIVESVNARLKSRIREFQKKRLTKI